MKLADIKYQNISAVMKLAVSVLCKVENWLLPERCMQCANVVADGDAYCAKCYLSLPFQTDACVRCGQVYIGVSESCGRCINNPPPQQTTFYPFSYNPPISDAIQQLKYSERPEHARRLALLLAAEIHASGMAIPDLLVPVPMHLSRLRKRGYNQAALLCKYLAQALEIQYDLRLVLKVRNTLPQVEMSLSQRKENVRKTFSISKKPEYDHIAVIDDVLTTGSTAAEVCNALSKKGVTTLQVWTLAHTL